MYLVGGWATYPSEKYDGLRQLGWWFFPIYRKIKNVPNHQPGLYLTLAMETMAHGNTWFMMIYLLKHGDFPVGYIKLPEGNSNDTENPWAMFFIW
jgi:hypothetical protein